MPTRNINQVVDYIRRSKSAYKRAQLIAMLETLQVAEAEAKGNIIKNFTGRWSRKLSGRMLNAVFTEIDKVEARTIQGGIGTRGIPYGRIHEYGSDGLPGGVIRHINARHLWMKLWEVPADLRRMTPTEFFNAKKVQPDVFKLLGDPYGRRGGGDKPGAAVYQYSLGQYIVLFYLLKSVKIKARQYLRPAVRVAMAGYKKRLMKRFAEQVGK